MTPQGTGARLARRAKHRGPLPTFTIAPSLPCWASPSGKAQAESPARPLISTGSRGPFPLAPPTANTPLFLWALVQRKGVKGKPRNTADHFASLCPLLPAFPSHGSSEIVDSPFLPLLLIFSLSGDPEPCGRQATLCQQDGCRTGRPTAR